MKLTKVIVRIYMDTKRHKIKFVYYDEHGNYLFSRSYDYKTIKMLYGVNSIFDVIRIMKSQ